MKTQQSSYDNFLRSKQLLPFLSKLKVLRQISVLLCCLSFLQVSAQKNYHLFIKGVDVDSSTIISSGALTTSFESQFECNTYLIKLPGLFQSRGFVTASIDSIKYDSTSAFASIFLGQQYHWVQLNTHTIPNDLLDAIGWREKAFANVLFNFADVHIWQERMLNQLENTGYPFAKVYLDSLQLDGDKVTAQMKVNPGPLFKIDSIKVTGNAKIANLYLQRYLEINAGSVYNKDKLLAVDAKIRELAYIEQEQPANITMHSTGAYLNLYLKQKRSSQINALIGFLPNSDQLSSKKLLITGEANMLLKNALGAGEVIGLNWQQLQVKSPRLNIYFNYPYIFRSPVGLDFKFDIFQKDSSFVNINLQAGAHYILDKNQSGKLFIQRFQTYLSNGGIDSNRIIQSHQLPDVGDVNSVNLGLEYDFNNTDYRLNPKKGSEFQITTTIGSKKIKMNNSILQLKDPSSPNFDFAKLYDTLKLNSYQLRVRLMAAKYFPFASMRSTIKTAINAGVFQSGNVFRNELFQIGGYKLLRGFDEESQYLSHFSIATVEYHYLVGQNSFFYILADGGWGRNSTISSKANYTYIGTGIGLAFETKAGIFNLAWAVGKRNDTEFNLRQSKVHVGFVNYF